MSSAPRPTHEDAPVVPPRMDAPLADRLRSATDTMRELSALTDPTRMVAAFARQTERWFHRDRTVSLSRRDTVPPWYHVTRSSDWTVPVDPWRDKSRLPRLAGGLLGELIHGGALRVLDDFHPSPRDPSYVHLQGMRSLLAIPLFDSGEALNMIVMMARKPRAFDHRILPDLVIRANLFGRATHNLVLASRLRQTNADMDREMKRIGRLQRALLPATLPDIPGVSIAVSYETAARAGGDYYDFFDLGDGRWGLFIGDVSGHGASAAVVMAITRTLLHARCQASAAPADVLAMVNTHLIQDGDRYDGTFVTAFYGIFDPKLENLTYSSAGHNPPILMRADGEVIELDRAQTYPLAILRDWVPTRATQSLHPGDTLLMYTDGITEAAGADGRMYGRRRLHACMSDPTFSARGVIDCILGRLAAFTEEAPAQDDRTLLALRLTAR